MQTVAIIIPIYNSEKYLKSAVDSVIDQTYKNIEIILVNDGSTDSSRDICTEYLGKDKRISYLELDHKGPAFARMEGVKKAASEYIVFCDADDFMDEDLIESLMRYKDYDLVCSGIAEMNLDSTVRYRHCALPVGVYAGREKMDYLISNMIFVRKNRDQGILVSCSGKLHKKHIIMKIVNNLDLRIRYGEDRDFTYQYILCCQNVVICDFSKYRYVKRDDSSSLRYDPNFFIDANRLRDSLEKTFSKHHLGNILISQLMEQMRVVYIYGMNNKLGYENYFSIPYICPCVMDRHKKIVIFGAGKVGKSYRAYLSLFPDKVLKLWVDNNRIGMVELGEQICPVEMIKSTEYDAIWVAVASLEARGHIRNQLLSMGIDDSKIYIEAPVPTYRLYMNC